MKFGDWLELFESDSLKWIDIAFFAAIGGNRKCKLPGGVPTNGALLREEFGEVAEKRHAGERRVAGVVTRFVGRFIVGDGVGG